MTCARRPVALGRRVNVKADSKLTAADIRPVDLQTVTLGSFRPGNVLRSDGIFPLHAGRHRRTVVNRLNTHDVVAIKLLDRFHVLAFPAQRDQLMRNVRYGPDLLCPPSQIQMAQLSGVLVAAASLQPVTAMHVAHVYQAWRASISRRRGTKENLVCP